MTNDSSYHLYNIKDADSKDIDDFITRFSKIKLGDNAELEKAANELVIKIKQKIPNLNSYIVSCVPSFIPTSATKILTKKIARKLKLEFVKLSWKPWKVNKYYLDMTLKERTDILKKVIYYKGPDISRKKVILIDDCIATGTAIRISKSVLADAGVKEFKVFSFVKFPTPTCEISFSKRLYAAHGISGLVDILNNKKNKVTSRMVSQILFLQTSQRKHILDSIYPKKRKLLKKTATRYCNQRQIHTPKELQE